MLKTSTFAYLALLLLQGGLGAPSIEPSLMRTLLRGDTADVLVTMREDTSSVLEGLGRRNFRTRGDRLTTMATLLQELAKTSQANVINVLEEELTRPGNDDFSYKSFWISNQIYIQGASLGLIQKLRELGEIASVEGDKEVRFDDPIEPSPGGSTSTCPSEGDNGTVWGVNMIEAPRVWNEDGNSGAGIVVATIDTGVRSSHEALRDNFRSSYGWFDSSSGTAEPNDSNSHGTHVTGTILGRTRSIGVAPGSQWIACTPAPRPTLSKFIACGQWVACPTDPYGNNPNCSMAPHVVSNSWGSGQGDRWYQAVVDVWQAADIIPVFSLGNSGPHCDTAHSPGDYQNVIGVGATECQQDTLAMFSSVGPSRSGSWLKPDVVAPGVAVWSSAHSSDTGYGYKSGTSMAAPHVAGTVALMLASRPQDRPCFKKVREALQRSSVKIPGQGRECNGVGDDQQPNYHHGYGRINAFQAVQIYKGMTGSST